jgi:type IV pilus assembly protein PilB
MPVKLGELLLKENMVTPQQLQEALSYQKRNGGKLGKAFVTLGYVRDEEITSLLSRQYGVPSINLEHFESTRRSSRSFPRRPRASTRSCRSSRSGATLTIAMADPTNVFAMDDIKFMTGYNVEPVVASETLARGGDREVLRLDALAAAEAGRAGGGGSSGGRSLGRAPP